MTTMDPTELPVCIFISRSLARSDFSAVSEGRHYDGNRFLTQTAFNTGMSKSLSRALKGGLKANYAFIFQHKGAESPENHPISGSF